ncbi:hypothetical protein [Vibrio sp. D431a]|uniref:beta barrel domain-containing protein n=1 Tax=Vibrio sp. D431a TaxID=2837388 RepID=UPI0025553A72|nr:hypothetical protein [Vibrio sp. D431a]MDK9793735.1 hypothetical protein [Vibrio sp. D431a]
MAAIKMLEKKVHEGTEIYIQGKDNARNRGGITPLRKIFVKKVNPKTVILVDNEGKELKLSHTGQGGANFNYAMYASLEDFKAHLCRKLIQDKFDFYNRDKVSTETVLKIAELLEIDLNITEYVKDI